MVHRLYRAPLKRFSIKHCLQNCLILHPRFRQQLIKILQPQIQLIPRECNQMQNGTAFNYASLGLET